MSFEQRIDIPPTRQPITVEWFLTLVRGGPLQGKGRFELIEGEIFRMAPQFARHSTATRRIANRIEEAIETANLSPSVYSQISLQVGETGMPEPDVVVADWSGDGAVPIDKAIIAVEVSDSSLAYDLKRKARLYARYGVPEYWVIDLPNAQIHQMSGPTTKGYAAIEVHPLGTRVTSKVVPEIQLDTAALA